ncbi:polar amino acid ABC transporter ATPase [Halogeometricum borinquense DSM 11551]|uniref:ABC-type polar amino acid transport system, ATPase component n=3 Tax=Halogeometricum borinquense TaxID=60847 RepID=E4NLZ7_HALBP|nr:ABC-type polar amino acid transport system, ATPase component [Halogeometricum borinquense DSM 11551]ELY27408.1 polar amino acid ABC transporter ATPase [Halogeometricum borinquense DSM 11551]RYJ13736.1 phosphate ABC transporter ATP-binding protein [Halogeometricum borinquense]
MSEMTGVVDGRTSEDDSTGGLRLAAHGVTHGFDGETVFSDVSLAVEPGEVLAVVGPSGSGKTTLLRLLACLESPAEGVVTANGRNVGEMSEEERLHVRRRLGMVLQHRCLFSATVASNAAYGLRVRATWNERIRAAIRGFLGTAETPLAAVDALETVGMVDKQDRHAASLSGGEAQRVAIARALAPEPDVLLFDEPTSNLDPRNTAIVEKAICDARDRGMGVCLATHDMQQAQRVSDRTAVLLGGEIIECGPTGQVFEEPSDRRTRKFVEGELVY